MEDEPILVRHYSKANAQQPFPTYSQLVKNNFSLAVEKGILAEDIAIASASQWADYVFAEDYQLTSLEDLEAYLKQNKHLPEVISESEIKEQGFYSLPDVMVGQLKNLEEQVLHNIAQEKKIKEQAERLEKLEEVVQKLLANQN